MASEAMTKPEIEVLLDKVLNKFELVTLGATRARQINDYVGQLGAGIGTAVPPQVASTARKPLSIAFEEIAADKIIVVRDAARRKAEAEAAAAADAAALAADAAGDDESPDA